MAKRHRLGVTLIELVVAIALVGIGIAGALGAMSQLLRAEALGKDREAMSRLAYEKLDELLATQDYTGAQLEGDFADRGDGRFAWQADVAPTGVDNVDEISVTVTQPAGDGQIQVRTLIYRPPTTTAVGGAL